MSAMELPKSSSIVQQTVMAHVFAFSLLAVLFKQLRFGWQSVGIFEVLAAVEGIYFAAVNTNRRTLADRTFSSAALTVLAAFCIGATISTIFFPVHLSLRDVVATIYVGILLVGWLNFWPHDVAGKAKLLRNYIVAYAAFTLLVSVPTLGEILFPWYLGVYFGRLQGLSDNPNQLASICLVGIVLTALVAQLGGTSDLRNAISLGILLACGSLTQSFSFLLSLCTAFATACLLFASRRASWSNFQRLLAVSIATGTIAGVTGLVLYWNELLEALQYLYSGGSGKGSVRLGYWLIALGEFWNSPVSGFGPGGHVKIQGTLELQEAHNIFIDCLMSGGLLGLGPLVFVCCVTLVLAIKRRQPLVLFAIVALVVFASFQTVLRYAIYWAALHVTLYAAMSAAVRVPVMSGDTEKVS